MLCPRCQFMNTEAAEYCSHCGLPFAFREKPKTKKGTRWIPMLVLILLFSFGMGVWIHHYDPPAPPQASETPWFQVINGELFFIPSRYTGGEVLTIPETVGGQTVRSISDYCFWDSNDIVTVILPDTVEVIGEGAFMDCKQLRGIYIPKSVKQIGTEAFLGCTALEAVKLQNSLQDIGANAFTDCGKLKYVFFTGSYKEWKALYQEEIAAETRIYCSDGDFSQ